MTPHRSRTRSFRPAMIVTGIWCLLAGILPSGCQAPPAPVRKIDTAFLADYAVTRGFSAGQPAGIELTPGGEAVLFLRSGPRDVVRDLYEINTTNGVVKVLARAGDLLAGKTEELSAEEKARRERRRESSQGLVWYKLSPDGTKVLTGVSGQLLVINRADGKLQRLPENQDGPAMDAKFSPDGQFVACIRGYDLYVTELATNREARLTHGGTADLSHGVAEFVAQEEMGRHSGYWWSGDSQWIAYQECDQREVEKLYIADARNPDSEPQGWRYPRVGKANARVRLGIISVTGGETKWVEWDREKYPYMATVHWGEVAASRGTTDAPRMSAPLTIYVQTREQREALLLLADPLNGRTSTLLRENDPAWINIDSDMPRWLPGAEEFLWTSERSGQWEVELRRKDGMLVKSMRPGTAQLFGVIAVDGPRRELIVSGSSDPTQSHLFRLSLDGGELVSLTREPGLHSAKFSKDCNTWVHTASLTDGAISHSVRSRDATLRGELPSKAEKPPFIPAPELKTVSVGDLNFHALILRPRDFKRGVKYPVLNYVYGGPSSNMVTASARAQLRQQWMADQGFIIVSIDARGTERRGRAWSRATRGNLIDVPLADQAVVMQALGEQHPEMDMARVGIYGWSFGGYFSAMAVLKRPDVFHAAIAGAPVIDWTDYDTHYTERYMGTLAENAEGYRICSALTYAENLRRPLLLIHGTTDDNVYFTHSLKMSEALFKAGKIHDLLALPGFTHMVPDPTVTVRLYERMAGFFQQHLAENRPEKIAVQEKPVESSGS